MIGDKEDKEGDKRDHHGHRKVVPVPILVCCLIESNRMRVTRRRRKTSEGSARNPPLLLTRRLVRVSIVDCASFYQVAQRYKLVQELLSSERAHGDNLTSVVNNYLKPLSEQAIISKTGATLPCRSTLTLVDVADLFCNIELVRNWSVAFREDLEELLGPKLDGEFGERFEEMVRGDP